MKTASILLLAMLMALLASLLAAPSAQAQRGDIVIPTGAQMHVPSGAQICADRIFANGPGHGTLTIGRPQCLCPGMSVVPVELLAFTASATDGAVLLRWTTATETNCSGFEVQRALREGNPDWRALGFVPGGGTTTQAHDYAFTDELDGVPHDAGTLYYRLRSVDFDGSFAYSPVVEVRFDAAASTFAFHPVYPNPATGRVTAAFTLPEPSAVTLTLYTVTGAEAARLIDERLFDRGSHSTSLPVPALGTGTYLLELRSAYGRRTQTVVLLE